MQDAVIEHDPQNLRHAAGAINIPVMVAKGPGQMQLNLDFVEVAEKVIPKGRKLVVGLALFFVTMACAREVAQAPASITTKSDPLLQHHEIRADDLPPAYATPSADWRKLAEANETVLYENPREVGADRIVNAVAAFVHRRVAG